MLKEHAENHCKLLKANQNTLAKVDKMKEHYTNMILNDVKLVASQLDKELERRFNVHWIQCIDKIKHLPVHREEVNVKVQNCLTGFELLRFASRVVIQKLHSNPLGKRGLNLRLVVTNVYVKPRPVYKVKGLVPWGSEFPTREGQAITDKLLEHQREYLQQMEQKHYNPNLATVLLHKLFHEIASHSTDITFTEEYRVDMALVVCGNICSHQVSRNGRH